MKYIAYYRVSTKKQGISGLGLEAQKEAVYRFISPESIDKEFTEVETGTNKKHRPILQEALELCKKTGATLIIAKLDRLTRNVSFVSSLMDSKVKFKAVDFPEANEMTIHILSAVAQNEAKLISTRIKDALAIKKAKGEKMGTPENLTEQDRLKGIESIKLKANNNQNNKRAIAFLRKSGTVKTSMTTLTLELNANGFLTSKGKQFFPMQVKRLLDKIKLLPASDIS